MGNKKTRQDLLPGTLDMLILKSLTRGVMHGYGIVEHIRTMSDEVLKVEEGSLYPALQRLQLQGLIDSEWGHSVNNRRARYYRLTAAGRKQLGLAESSFDAADHGDHPRHEAGRGDAVMTTDSPRRTRERHVAQSCAACSRFSVAAVSMTSSPRRSASISSCASGR